MLEHLTNLGYIEIVEEEVEEQNAILRLTFRVRDMKEWASRLQKMMLSAEDESDFVMRVRQEYYVEDGKCLFKWYLIVWGGLAEAAEFITEHLSPTDDVRPLVIEPTAAAEPQSILMVEKVGGVTVTTVPLAHPRGSRDAPTKDPVHVGSRIRGVHVTGTHPGA